MTCKKNIRISQLPHLPAARAVATTSLGQQQGAGREISFLLFRNTLEHRRFANVYEWLEEHPRVSLMPPGTHDSMSSHQEDHQAARSWQSQMRFDEPQQRLGDRPPPNARAVGRSRNERAHLSHGARHHHKAPLKPRRTRGPRWEKSCRRVAASKEAGSGHSTSIFLTRSPTRVSSLAR